MTSHKTEGGSLVNIAQPANKHGQTRTHCPLLQSHAIDKTNLVFCCVLFHKDEHQQRAKRTKHIQDKEYGCHMMCVKYLHNKILVM